MDFVNRRREIISILSARGHITARELSGELDVSVRTIHHDIVALSLAYPVYTKQGAGGGIFLMESYKPYANTLTGMEQEILTKLYEDAEGKERDILFQILRKYGADKLKI